MTSVYDTALRKLFACKSDEMGQRRSTQASAMLPIVVLRSFRCDFAAFRALQRVRWGALRDRGDHTDDDGKQGGSCDQDRHSGPVAGEDVRATQGLAGDCRVHPGQCALGNPVSEPHEAGTTASTRSGAKTPVAPSTPEPAEFRAKHLRLAAVALQTNDRDEGGEAPGAPGAARRRPLRSRLGSRFARSS